MVYCDLSRHLPRISDLATTYSKIDFDVVVEHSERRPNKERTGEREADRELEMLFF